MEEKVKEIAEKLREFVEYARSNNAYRNFGTDEYYVYLDLGQFGEQETAVSVELEDEEIDLERLVDDEFPVSLGDLDGFADDLDRLADETSVVEGDGLEEALVRLEGNGQGALARAIRAIVETFEGAVLKASDMNELSVGPLPAKPLPWPGALRPEIDYTAADFPLRYNPPPGYAWTPKSPQRTALAPDKAEFFTVEELRENDRKSNYQMVMDDKGRVCWIVRDDDKLEQGIRWSIWFTKYLDIPAGTGDFATTTRPLAISADGDVINGWQGSVGGTTVWGSSDAAARKRIKEIQAEYQASLGAPPANNTVLGYNPRTVPTTTTGGGRVSPADLRLGDLITGSSYGKVLSVRQLDSSNYEFRVLKEDGTERTFMDNRDGWYIKVIEVPDRDSVPTALKLSEEGMTFPSADNEYGATYDPRTVATESALSYVFTEQLRPGDYVESFGKVLTVERAPDIGGYKLVFDRDGDEVIELRASYNWEMRKIEDWDAYPTALSISERKRFGYDPLTVGTLSDKRIQVKDMRPGDNITSSAFGRLLEIRRRVKDGALELVMWYSGKINTYGPVQPTTDLNVRPVDVPARASVPTVLSLLPGAPGGDAMQTQEEKLVVTTAELRVGDDIIGEDFGKLLRIDGTTLVMDRDGTENTYDAAKYMDGEWQVFPIDVPDRSAVPAALVSPF